MDIQGDPYDWRHKIIDTAQEVRHPMEVPSYLRHAGSLEIVPPSADDNDGQAVRTWDNPLGVDASELPPDTSRDDRKDDPEQLIWSEATLLEAFALSPFDPHPVDILRPDFEQHVVSPLGHVAVVTTIDKHYPAYKDALAGERGDNIRWHVADVTYKEKFNPQIHAMFALNFIQTYISRTWADDGLAPDIWPLLRPLQQAAAGRFNTFGAGNHNFGLASMAMTVNDTLQGTIHPRHPELGLEDATNLIAFLRDPHTPSMFRGGIMLGGAAFAGAMRGVGHHTHTESWRSDLQKPVLTHAGSFPRPTSELRQAAIAHRANKVQEGERGGILSPRRHSRGCPSRTLTFTTAAPNLVNNGLELTSGQIEALTKINGSVIETSDDAVHFKVRRDNVAAMCLFLADGVEIVANTKRSV